MGHIRESVHLNVPIERAYDFVADATRWPEWQTNLIAVKDVSGQPGEPGFSYTAVYRALGRTFDGHFTLSRAERPNIFVETGEMPGTGQATMTNHFEPAPDGGTDCTFTMDYEMSGGFLGGIADKLLMERSIERDIRHSTENLKALAEAAQPVTVG